MIFDAHIRQFALLRLILTVCTISLLRQLVDMELFLLTALFLAFLTVIFSQGVRLLTMFGSKQGLQLKYFSVPTLTTSQAMVIAMEMVIQLSVNGVPCSSHLTAR